MELKGRSPLEWREDLLSHINKLYNQILAGDLGKVAAGIHRQIRMPAAKVVDLMELPGCEFSTASSASYNVKEEKFDRKNLIDSVLKMRFMKKNLKYISMAFVENLDKEYWDRAYGIYRYRYNHKLGKIYIQREARFSFHEDLISHMEEEGDPLYIGMAFSTQQNQKEMDSSVILVEIFPERTS